jgi:hypothetical protein
MVWKAFQMYEDDLQIRETDYKTQTSTGTDD